MNKSDLVKEKAKQKGEKIRAVCSGLLEGLTGDRPVKEWIKARITLLKTRANQPFLGKQMPRVKERVFQHGQTIQPYQQQIQQNFPRVETPIRKGLGEMLSRVSVSEKPQETIQPPPKRTEPHREREETFMPELAVSVDNWKSYSVEQKRKKKMSEITIEE